MTEVPPSPPFEREELHTRTIALKAYRRSDGLFEVEARLRDTKPNDFTPFSGDRIVPAGCPVHDLGVRIVHDADFLVHDVETFAAATPYSVCPGGGLALERLKGVRMVAGWRREIQARLGRSESCTHLVELLGPLATVAFQASSTDRRGRPEPVDATGRPRKIDSCFAYAATGDLVKRMYPAFHVAPIDGDK